MVWLSVCFGPPPQVVRTFVSEGTSQNAMRMRSSCLGLDDAHPSRACLGCHCLLHRANLEGRQKTQCAFCMVCMGHSMRRTSNVVGVETFRALRDHHCMLEIGSCVDTASSHSSLPADEVSLRLAFYWSSWSHALVLLGNTPCCLTSKGFLALCARCNVREATEWKRSLVSVSLLSLLWRVTVGPPFNNGGRSCDEE